MSVRGTVPPFGPADNPGLGIRWTGVIASQYFLPFTFSPGANTQVLVINTWYAMPMYLPGLVITKLCLELTAGGVGNGRMALWDADGTTQLPNALQVDSGNFSVNTTGIVENTVASFTFLDRLYWIGINTAVACTARSGNIGETIPVTTGADFTGARRAITRALAFAAPPDPFGTPAGTTFGCPMLAVKQ